MYYIGIDLGKQRDPTAVAVIEKEAPHPIFGVMAGQREIRLVGLERVPLGTPYLEFVERMQEVTSRREFTGCAVAVDATGVGAPVVEALRKALRGCEVRGVTITSGERGSQKGLDYTVPKQDLMGGLQLLLERGDLRISSALPDAWALKKELMNVRSTARPGGRVRIGADGYGEHDDLVSAVGMAFWLTHRKTIGWGEGRLPGI